MGAVESTPEYTHRREFTEPPYKTALRRLKQETKRYAEYFPAATYRYSFEDAVLALLASDGRTNLEECDFHFLSWANHQPPNEKYWIQLVVTRRGVYESAIWTGECDAMSREDAFSKLCAHVHRAHYRVASALPDPTRPPSYESSKADGLLNLEDEAAWEKVDAASSEAVASGKNESK